ncbi:6-phospho-3-hexuloisomerase [Virgibacillus phasianinus]|uniref:6-phospho-3-hexuloisomerase n=1 Tax=Virgibacillus phasianinus TaxID=2017483 RepID=A0A220U6V7_9BACI|nr:6-phospho-3-hexuloisomerase [Virgibacillus phasianinus]ASK63857.1 6-phospho-3-hexuloisomerase [Virgibacillus phasianinus]
MGMTKQILTEINQVVEQIQESDMDEVVKAISHAERIFVIGEGRSGLMAKSFAMRLMHIGATVYVIGETITPSLHSGDLLIAISGSGKTHQVVWSAMKAKENDVQVYGLTTDDTSPLANEVDHTLILPAATKYRKANEAKSIQPLGSLFDQSAHIVFDTLCLQYAQLKKVTQNDALKAHSNIE